MDCLGEPTNALSNGTNPTPYTASPSPILGVSNFGDPLLSQERVKLQTSNFVCIFIGSIGTKAHEKNLRKIAIGVVRLSRNFSGHIIGLWAHCAVIFAIAQLSCIVSCSLSIMAILLPYFCVAALGAPIGARGPRFLYRLNPLYRH